MRPTALQDFLDTAERSILSDSAPADVRASAARLFASLATPAGSRTGNGARVPVCSWLDKALQPLQQRDDDAAQLANAFATLEPLLQWKPRSSGANASAGFTDNHANTVIAGPGGLEERRDVWVGASLLAPGIRYPDHDHAPEEVYFVLSGGEFRQEDSEWFQPGVGGMFYNRPGIQHAMRAGEEPLLALWFLTVG